MNTPPIDPELLARLLHGTLTPSEWESVRATLSEQTIRDILDADARLHAIMHAIVPSTSDPANVQRIMTAVMDAPAPNRTFLRVIRLAPYLGAAVFLVGIVGMLATVSVTSDTQTAFELPHIDASQALWAMAVAVVLGVGVWRMESA